VPTCGSAAEDIGMTPERRVLIVEDEPAIGLALEDMVENLGWVVVGVAARVQQGLDLVQACAPTFAILDVNLHGEQSYPIADALADSGVPYIFATGYGDSAHPPRHRQVLTLTKPYSLQALQNAIAAAVCDQFRQRD
jgi:DNA-binding response OmpR family regulator